jgi:hypothetical protein
LAGVFPDIWSEKSDPDFFRRASTLIELLAAFAIIAILADMRLPVAGVVPCEGGRTPYRLQ